MLSTLLLTFFCAAPAQEPAPLIDALPDDSLVVMQLSLEPWDRLRKNTRAHGVVRGKNLLLSMMEKSGVPEGERKGMRTSLGAIRVTMAVTPQSIELGGALFLLEPVNVGAASVDWKQQLADIAGFEPGRFGRTFVTFLGESSPEARQEYVAQVVEAAEKNEGTLGTQAAWKALRGSIETPNDLMRVYVPGWNLLSPEFFGFIEAIDPTFDEEVQGVIKRVLEMVAVQHGMAWTTSIEGADFVDRMLFPRESGMPQMYTELGSGASTLDKLARVPAAGQIVTIFGFNWSLVMRSMGTMVGELMGADPSVPAEEREMFDAIMGTVMAVADQLGDETVSWQPIDALAGETMSNFSVAVKDRAKLLEAWGELPEEFNAVVLFLLLSLGATEDSIELTEDRLNMVFSQPEEGAGLVGETADFKRVRPEVLQWLGEAKPLFVQLYPSAVDRDSLSELGSLVQAFGMLTGMELSMEGFDESDLSGLRPTWVAAQRSARGIEVYGRSNFGVVTSVGILSLVQAAGLLQAEGGLDDFEEEEF